MGEISEQSSQISAFSAGSRNRMHAGGNGDRDLGDKGKWRKYYIEYKVKCGRHEIDRRNAEFFSPELACSNFIFLSLFSM